MSIGFSATNYTLNCTYTPAVASSAGDATPATPLSVVATFSYTLSPCTAMTYTDAISRRYGVTYNSHSFVPVDKMYPAHYSFVGSDSGKAQDFTESNMIDIFFVNTDCPVVTPVSAPKAASTKCTFANVNSIVPSGAGTATDKGLSLVSSPTYGYTGQITINACSPGSTTVV